MKTNIFFNINLNSGKRFTLSKFLTKKFKKIVFKKTEKANRYGSVKPTDHPTTKKIQQFISRSSFSVLIPIVFF